ncbi:MAG TPA: VRR-NUC domain-containing protein [Rhizomicrobium sp.]|nr:VRR-NUC domain-containing protein [Rhizomicrobium sp.]
MRARRTDATQKAIAAAFRQLGWKVIDLSAVGKGCPDLMISRAGTVRLIECKTDKGKLTPAQQERIAEGWPVQIVRRVEDAAEVR